MQTETLNNWTVATDGQPATEKLSDFLANCGNIDSVSWKAAPDMTYEEWEKIGQRFQQINGSINWWLGDWLNEGERRYGETYSQAVELTGHKIDHLIKCKQVAGSVKSWTRVQLLSWTHHRYIAHLPESEQAMWLNHAADHGLSSRDLKKALELANAQKKPAEKTELNWVDDTPQDPPLPDSLQQSNVATEGTDEPPFANRNSVLYDDDYSAEASAYAGSSTGYDWSDDDDEPLLVSRNQARDLLERAWRRLPSDGEQRSIREWLMLLENNAY